MSTRLGVIRRHITIGHDPYLPTEAEGDTQERSPGLMSCPWSACLSGTLLKFFSGTIHRYSRTVAKQAATGGSERGHSPSGSSSPRTRTQNVPRALMI